MPGMINRQVNFAPSATYGREAGDDEIFVMEQFSAHASHCRQCCDPYRVHLMGETLCERGHAYARDVAQYIYSKGGKAFSVVDRQRSDERVHVEVPAGCDAIRGLLKAVDRGLRIRKEKPVISHDRTYDVPERHPVETRDHYNVIEVQPRGRREERRGGDEDRRHETVYVPGRGSLYQKDEEDRRRRQRHYHDDQEPVIIYARPGRRNRR